MRKKSIANYRIVRLAELKADKKVDEILAIKKIIKSQLDKGVRARTRIQSIINLNFDWTISSREISFLISEIEVNEEFEKTLEKIQEKIGGLQVKKLKKTTNEILQRTGFMPNVLQIDPVLELGDFDKYEQEVEEVNSELDENLKKLDELQKGDRKPTSQERLAFAMKSEFYKNKIAAINTKRDTKKTKLDILLKGVGLSLIEKKQQIEAKQNQCDKQVDVFLEDVKKEPEDK